MLIGMVGKYPDEEFSAHLGLFREMGVDVLDVQTAEVTDDVRRFVAQARDRGLPVASLEPRWGWIDRALKDAGEIAQMQRFIQAEAALGIRTLNVSCSMVVAQHEAERQEHFGRVVDIFRQVCAVAEAEGVTLCSHTTMFRRGILFGSVAGVDAFLAAVGSSRNTLLFCCGCISAAEEDVPALARRWKGQIGCVHLFNPRGNRDHYDEVRFDQGQMDMPLVLRTLHETGYDGLLLPHEYPAFGGPTGAPASVGREISHGWVIGYLVALRQVLGLRKEAA